MKKSKKVFIILVIIFVILFCINCVRNYFIFNKLFEKSNSFDFSNNYKIVQKSNSMGTDNVIWDVVSEYYCKDNIYLYKNNTILTQNSNKEITKYGVWDNKNSNEHIEFLYDDDNNIIKDELIDKENLEIPLNTIIFSNNNFSNIFKSIILSENETYKITSYYNEFKEIIYVNKNTGLIDELSYIYNNSLYTITNTYEKNVVTSEMVEKPNF